MDVEIQASSTIVYTKVAAVSLLSVPGPSYTKITTYVFALWNCRILHVSTHVIVCGDTGINSVESFHRNAKWFDAQEALTFKILPITWCTNSLTFNNCTLCPTLYLCVFVFIWEQTATCTTSSINWLVFIAEMKSVYSAVRTGSLNKAVCVLYLSENKQRLVPLTA